MSPGPIKNLTHLGSYFKSKETHLRHLSPSKKDKHYSVSWKAAHPIADARQYYINYIEANQSWLPHCCKTEIHVVRPLDIDNISWIGIHKNKI